MQMHSLFFNLVKKKLQDDFLVGDQEGIHKTFDEITSLSKTVYSNRSFGGLFIAAP